jgi:hypothetical protein
MGRFPYEVLLCPVSKENSQVNSEKLSLTKLNLRKL